MLLCDDPATIIGPADDADGVAAAEEMMVFEVAVFADGTEGVPKEEDDDDNDGAVTFEDGVTKDPGGAFVEDAKAVEVEDIDDEGNDDEDRDEDDDADDDDEEDEDDACDDDCDCDTFEPATWKIW